MKKVWTTLALATLLIAGIGFAGCASKKCEACTDGSCAVCIEKGGCADCKAAGALCPAHAPK